MKSFKNFIAEQDRSKNEISTELKDAGYAKIRSIKGRTITVEVKGDRVTALRDIASKLNGTYNDKFTGSSIGRTELDDGWKILVKSPKGGGSGAGAELTKTVESAQCIYLAAAYYGKKPPFNINVFKSVQQYFDVDASFEDAMNLPDDWIQSSIKVAEKLRGEFKKKYVFHRGSSWVDQLENHWKKLNKKEKAFSNLNKWSPADIYMVSPAGRQIDFSQTQSIHELNTLLLKAIKSKDIVGVSLKKVGKKVNMEFKNVDSKRKEYKIKSWTTGKRGFFESNDTFLFYEGGQIQFRTFGRTWQGEIKGKFANQGKISGGPIATVMANVLGVRLNAQKDMKMNETNMEQFYKWYTFLEKKPLSYEEFKRLVEEKGSTFYTSMIMGSQFLYHFAQASKDNQNKILSGILGYAASESELSGPYVKCS